MSRDLPFDANDKCEVCGKQPAWDFMGDVLCSGCSERKRNPVVWDSYTEPKPGDVVLRTMRGRGIIRLCMAVSRSLATGKPVIEVAQAPYKDQYANPFWITLQQWRRWCKGAKVIHHAS